METWDWTYNGIGYVCDDYFVYRDGDTWQCENSAGMIGFSYDTFAHALNAASRTAGNGHGYHTVDTPWPTR